MDVLSAKILFYLFIFFVPFLFLGHFRCIIRHQFTLLSWVIGCRSESVFVCPPFFVWRWGYCRGGISLFSGLECRRSTRMEDYWSLQVMEITRVTIVMICSWPPWVRSATLSAVSPRWIQAAYGLAWFSNNTTDPLQAATLTVERLTLWWATNEFQLEQDFSVSGNAVVYHRCQGGGSQSIEYTSIYF